MVRLRRRPSLGGRGRFGPTGRWRDGTDRLTAADRRRRDVDHRRRWGGVWCWGRLDHRRGRWRDRGGGGRGWKRRLRDSIHRTRRGRPIGSLGGMKEMSTIGMMVMLTMLMIWVGMGISTMSMQRPPSTAKASLDHILCIGRVFVIIGRGVGGGIGLLGRMRWIYVSAGQIWSLGWRFHGAGDNDGLVRFGIGPGLSGFERCL